jgi:hypothetical protein
VVIIILWTLFVVLAFSDSAFRKKSEVYGQCPKHMTLPLPSFMCSSCPFYFGNSTTLCIKQRLHTRTHTHTRAHIPTHSLSYPLTLYPTPTFPLSYTRTHTHSLTLLPSHSVPHSHFPALTHARTPRLNLTHLALLTPHSLTVIRSYSQSHSTIRSPFRLPTHSLTRSVIHPLIQSLTDSLALQTTVRYQYLAQFPCIPFSTFTKKNLTYNLSSLRSFETLSLTVLLDSELTFSLPYSC